MSAEWWPAYITEAFGNPPVTDAQLDAAGDEATALVRDGYGPVIDLLTGERVG